MATLCNRRSLGWTYTKTLIQRDSAGTRQGTHHLSQPRRYHFVAAVQVVVVTTAEHLEPYHIVRAILARDVDPARVVLRDTKSYCGVLLDDDNRRPICRLRFDHAQKFLALPNAGDAERPEPIVDPAEIYRFADDPRAALFYDSRRDWPVVGATEAATPGPSEAAGVGG